MSTASAKLHANLDLLDEVLDYYKALTYEGFAVGDTRRISPAERAGEVHRSRAKMRTRQSLDQFARCYDWLDRQPRTENINRRAGTSYSLKEEVEAESSYVSDGMFIAAAIGCGYLVEQAGDSRSAWLSIGQLRSSNPNLDLLIPHPAAARLRKERAGTLRVSPRDPRPRSVRPRR
jgi:hypothetical protein